MGAFERHIVNCESLMNGFLRRSDCIFCLDVDILILNSSVSLIDLVSIIGLVRPGVYHTITMTGFGVWICKIRHALAARFRVAAISHVFVIMHQSQQQREGVDGME